MTKNHPHRPVLLPTRRQFLRGTAAAAAGWVLCPNVLGAADAAAPAAGAVATAAPSEAVSFFLVGDTHYYADKGTPGTIDPTSAATNGRLVDWLNKLPGTDVPAEAGGGKVPTPRGVIHAGDLIDSGDKGTSPVALKQQETELAAFAADWGVNGEGKLKWPSFEVHGNHDGPRGEGLSVSQIIARTAKRKGLAAVSDNGMHYGWSWGGVHFLALGIVVGGAPDTARARRYDPKGSYAFMEKYLGKHVGDSGAPVVITHHVDVARYSGPCDENPPKGNPEWDPCDAHAYYRAIGKYNVAAILFGHTHVRKIARWDGTPKEPAGGGVWAFNTDNAGHYKSQTQAVLHFEIGPKEMVVREFGTTDMWQTGEWTKQVWRFKPARGG
ncbi:MAG TPA: metallophosphoesterase [Humisphaera sp.]